MHWGCFSWQGVGPIVPIQGSVKGVSYVEILRKHAAPTFVRMFPKKKAWFQHDNARPHTAKVSTEFLQESGMRVLEWPAQSPDLNPIENLWAIVKRSIRERQKPPTNLPELERYVKAAWKAIPIATIRNLIDSMPRRIQAVIAAQGGATKY
jgi:transposase